MMKIVHIGKYYRPDSGGIESVTESLASGFVKAGHQLTVVCFEKTPAKLKQVIDGVNVVRAPIWRTIASQPIGLKYLWRCISEGRSADIVHIHVPNMLGALGSLFLGKKPKLVVHWHSDVIGKGILGSILRPLETALLKRADCIVATSPIYADASPILKRFSEKVNIIPIGIADTSGTGSLLSGSTFLSDDLNEKLTGKKLVLAVGRLVPYKGFEVLIKAAEKLSDDSAVVIVGSGELYQSLEKLISDLKLNGKVFLTGRLEDNALAELYRRADLFCLPSIERSEAFGVVLLEAMAYSLPIVASNIPGSGVPWVNQHEVSGLNVPVGDEIKLAEACNRILWSKIDSEKFSTGARTRFLSEFTEDISVTLMLNLYKNIL
ncbi:MULTISPECIES: glycosyltransferase [unclassified Undibacterium]|uniref:glycosyltransferase n=1 Tax=unclassified Undibacterium TaxID=2630295 RepID=UPI002AC981EC|nr:MULTISPECIES: glycosyltransferase [unclassified Undibacterium]MEB0140846.1 glycosyltransferase [Undibacterium sp. CCC2.1]MEB0173809.1 glycosyltransferase [Undibacterium sp. CCC1.1]MEB0177793.1 glycosyltransferase [Undibacterium sp. CCC3.4]MEB0217339.1 glycosyltransferase [Undibacterium sp. 5I2]WPX42158.1 glycosyltransferase [Undibacterium sp. CCC3.4]